MSQNKYPIRKSQLVISNGPGQIINFGNKSYVIHSAKDWIREWEKKAEMGWLKDYDSNSLKVQDLRVLDRFNLTTSNIIMVPEFLERKKEDTHDPIKNTELKIPMTLFPGQGYCPECKILYKYEQLQEDKKENDYYCTKCFQKNKKKNYLVKFRYIQVCPAGHMEDFNFARYVHPKSTPCDGADYYFKTKNNKDQIECSKCNSRRTMDGILALHKKGKPGEPFFRCSQSTPWRNMFHAGNNGGRDTGTCPCNNEKEVVNHPRIVLSSNSSVYFPIIKSIIYFPEQDLTQYDDLISNIKTSSRTQRLIQRALEDLCLIREDETLPEDKKDDEYKRIIDECIHTNESSNSSKDWWSSDTNKKFKEYLNCIFKKDGFTENSNLLEEFNFITSQNSFKSNDISFEKKDLANYHDIKNEPSIKNIYSVNLLKEYVVNKGFTRLYQLNDETQNQRRDWQNEEYAKKSLFSKETSEDEMFFPCYVNKGEGIFFEFEHKFLSEWASETKITSRILERYKCENEPRLLISLAVKNFIHTFSHMMIEALSYFSGYPSVNIKERIYLADHDEGLGQEMTGILLYTTSSSSEGSLGGLVRLSESDKLDEIFKKGLSLSSWCSIDPLCISSNPSSCHMCTHLTEVSCSHFNSSLDRAFLVPTLDDNFSPLIKEPDVE